MYVISMYVISQTYVISGEGAGSCRAPLRGREAEMNLPVEDKGTIIGWVILAVVSFVAGISVGISLF